MLIVIVVQMPVHIIVKDMRIMDMKIDQQVALDEPLVPHASRLRIGESNFYLRSDITSKESTLQLEFWATATVHHHSIRFKMDNKKCIVNLEYFREMLHVCPRLPGQTFDELPFKEEILTFFRFFGHIGEIRKLTNAQILWRMYHKENVDFAYLLWKDFVYQVEHMDAKKSNEMYYPRFTKVIIHYFMTKDPLIPRRNKFGVMLPVELTNEDIRNFEAYKEYYAIALGAAPPKTKASVRKTKSSFDTTITPLTIAGTRLSTLAKGKQHAKSYKAKDEGTGIIPWVPDVPTDEFDEEISWKSSDEDDDDEVDERSDDQEDDDDQDDDDDEDDDDQDDDDQDDNDDDQDSDNDGDDFVHPKLSIHEEEAKDEESFDPIIQTLKNSDDEGNDDASLGLNVGGEEGQDAEDDDEELYRDVNINLEGRDVQMTDVHTTQEFKDTRVILTSVNPDVKVAVQIQSDRLQDEAQAENKAFLNNLDENIQKIIKEQVKEQVKLQASKILPNNEKTVNEQLKAKVLTRSSNSSKTSYVVAADLSEIELKKMLIEKIKSNKSIYRSDEQRNLYKALMKNPPLDQTGGPRDEEKEKSQSQQALQRKRRPRPLASLLKGPNLIKRLQATFLMNQLKVDTLNLEFLVGPTYELMKGSCKSLVELEFFLEEVYKATTDQLDWNNPEGQQYPHNLLKPLLIPNSRGRRVIPFDHFINNDLEYLRGGASSRKFITSVTKTKAADYGHIKWIEDLSTWSLLEMSTQNVESSLSSNFRLSNDIITSIWIGSRCVEMMTSYTSSKKATSRGFTFKTLKICYCFWLSEEKVTRKEQQQ
uniref:Uncharacterized protein n=1 Tax=Tanacetum cinerariifolium TaxID=118510 RepID=A0A699HZ41_TANCI|nr:hypothetical protein [Tanacetum cinerariifolium]